MRNAAELEAQIAKSPNDPAPYLVYADWLTEQGDPRGELISVEIALDKSPSHAALQARRQALHEQHDAQWLGKLGPRLASKDVARVAWRYGFLHAAIFGADDYDTEEIDLGELYAELRPLPVASQLRELTFLGFSSDDGEPSWQSATDALVEHGVAPSLRRLVYDRGGYWDISWTYLGNLEPVYEHVANLETLCIKMGHMELGKIDLPALRELEVYTGGFTSENMKSVLGARWPRLERLILRFGDNEDYGASCTIDDVVPLFEGRLENLRHLAIGNAGFANDVVPLLAKSKLLRQLSSLDLSMGQLDDSGAAKLLEHADAFGHLERIDISESYVSNDVVAQLAKTFKRVDAGEQKDADDDYRYCTIGE